MSRARAIPGPLGLRGRRARAGRRAVLRALHRVEPTLQRGVDLVAVVPLLAVAAPLLAALAWRARRRTGRVFDRTPVLGRHRAPLARLTFAGGGRGAALAALFNVLRGELSLVGPRPLSPADAAALPAAALVRFDVRPGLVSAFALRQRTGIAYEREADVDREFVLAQSVGGDLGLLARAVPGALLGSGATLAAPPTVRLFDVPIANTTMDEAIEWLLGRATAATPTLAAFVNPDCLNIAYRDDAYRAVLHDAACVWPDGIGLRLGARLLGVSLRANVNGTDLFPRLCARLAESGQSLFLLGARPGVAAAAAAAMQARLPALRIAGTRDGYFADGDAAAVVDAINTSGADVLLVALGAPRQELWLARWHAALRPPVRIGVGGLFDYYSGRIPRAPQWVREVGLEWVWRLAQEPGRLWRRYLVGNPLFLYRVWRESRRRRAAPACGAASVTARDTIGRTGNASPPVPGDAAGPSMGGCPGMSAALSAVDMTGTSDVPPLRAGGLDRAARDELLRRYAHGHALTPWWRLRASLKRGTWLAVIGGTRVVKRLLDVVLSIALMLLLIPIFGIVALLIRLESPGPILFRQQRVGRHGQTFAMYKLRSMYVDAERRLATLRAQNEMAGGVTFKMKDDPRITRIGRYLRKGSIDELPQLWNVLKGDMSLVGPRPPVPAEVAQYTLLDRRRLEVTPGITCIWQVSGRSQIPFKQQVELDVLYIDSQSIRADLRLLLRTIPAVLLGRGAY